MLLASLSPAAALRPPADALRGKATVAAAASRSCAPVCKFEWGLFDTADDNTRYDGSAFPSPGAVEDALRNVQGFVEHPEDALRNVQENMQERVQALLQQAGEQMDIGEVQLVQLQTAGGSPMWQPPLMMFSDKRGDGLGSTRDPSPDVVDWSGTSTPTGQKLTGE